MSSESISASTSAPTRSTPPTPPKPLSVLFVCLGNICRSPMAEAVFRHQLSSHALSSQITHVDSAGTGAYHTGSPPDSRTMKALRHHGIKGYKHAARKVVPLDFEKFDWIFAMDADNLEDLVRMRKRVARNKGKEVVVMGKVMLWGDWGGEEGEEVIDPYYGADDGFEVAFEQMARFSKGFLKHVEEDMVEGEQK